MVYDAISTPSHRIGIDTQATPSENTSTSMT
jgi:hypothetical protein